jgi:glycosyltransferase involved in cell wall biosynthesis
VEQMRRGHDVGIVSRTVTGRPSAVRSNVVHGGLTKLVVQIARHLRRERPDVVHVHNLVSRLSFVTCVLKPFFDYRLVIDSHHSPINTRITTPARRIGATLFRMTAGRLIRRSADFIFAIAGPERTFAAGLLGCPESEIAVVPLGVDRAVFHPDPADRAATRARLGIEDDFVIVHAGRLVPEKRIDMLLDAALRIAATVLLVGTLDERLEPLVAAFQADGGRVIVAGVVDKAELASYLRAADAGVWMGFPSLSAVEAMAVGLPLLTCETQHFRELLGTDYEFFTADVHQLAELLVRLRDRPALARAVHARNVKRGAALGWDRIADRVEQIYA